MCGGDNSTCADCAGVPNGTAWVSDCGCVAANNSGDDCDDCAGTPNGDATNDSCGECSGGNSGHDADSDIDDCGVCFGGNYGDYDGDGTCDANDASPYGEASLSSANASEGSLDVLYSSDMAIYGFQFQVSGVTLTGASGAFDMISLNASNGSILGTSLSGASLDAGEGSLVTISFTPTLDGSVLSITDVIIGGQSGTNIVSSSPDDATIPACAKNDGDLSCNVADEWPDCSDDGNNPYDDCNECNGGNADKDCNGDCFGEA